MKKNYKLQNTMSKITNPMYPCNHAIMHPCIHAISFQLTFFPQLPIFPSSLTRMLQNVDKEFKTTRLK